LCSLIYYTSKILFYINKQSINNYRSFVEKQKDLVEYKAEKEVFGNKRFVTKFKKSV